MKKIAADVVIFGGGIAGLWLLNRLSQSDLSVLLCETNTLGGGQTVQSQGIIHGGLKYALQGVLNNETQVMTDVPFLWAQCLKGRGEIDLSHVPILSPKQYLWGPNFLASKFAGFLASAALTSKVASLTKEFYPDIFQHPKFKGTVFALDEMVLDVPVLIKELVKHHLNRIVKINSFSEDSFRFDEAEHLVAITTSMDGQPVEIKAQQFIFTAGAGNDVIIKKLNQKNIAMQRRPLHMVLAKMSLNHALYAHCLGLGSRPRMTITTHYRNDGSLIWYMGGALAEEGVARTEVDQIKAAKKELNSLFPWVDFNHAEFSSFLIDRAEPFQQNGLKPETSYVKTIKNIMIAWPTKLALAPKLADEIIDQLHTLKLTSRFKLNNDGGPLPSIATPIWENAFCKEQV